VLRRGDAGLKDGCAHVSIVLGSAVSQVRPHFLRFAKTLHFISFCWGFKKIGIISRFCFLHMFSILTMGRGTHWVFTSACWEADWCDREKSIWSVTTGPDVLGMWLGLILTRVRAPPEEQT